MGLDSMSQAETGDTNGDVRLLVYYQRDDLDTWAQIGEPPPTSPGYVSRHR